MITSNDKLYADFEAVRQIPIIPLMLEVICRTTGMGFAAVARVTDERWLACSVNDKIQFGLQPGGELVIETTICNEIRDSRKEVVIDHVAKSEKFKDHHTPAMYGFQSYISFPIILKNGTFFGTLCAIDPNPAKLENPVVMGTFAMFTELLSFHLQRIELMDRTHGLLHEANRKLTHANDENLQYKHMANHNLKEQIRKISVFSDLLLNDKDQDPDNIKKVATKINDFSLELGRMLEHLSDYSNIDNPDPHFEKVNLNGTIAGVSSRLSPTLSETNILLTYSRLPFVYSMPGQIEQLFYHLVNHVIAFSKHSNAPTIHIYADGNAPDPANYIQTLSANFDYCEIFVEIKNSGIQQTGLESIFDMFVHLNDNSGSEKYGNGLAYCRKIVHANGGLITASPLEPDGTLLSIILPVKKRSPECL